MKLITTIKINQSNVQILNFDEKNRTVCPVHVEKMKQSINEIGVTRNPVVIKIDGLYYIVDGQHLTRALIELGLPFECTVLDESVDILDAMLRLNEVNRRFDLTDYISAVSKNGNKDYQILADVIQTQKESQKYGITQISVICMVMAKSASRTSVTDSVKKKRFSIPDLEYSKDLIEFLNKAVAITDINTRQSNEALVKFIIKNGSVDYDLFIAKLKKHKKLLISANNDEKQLLETYRKIYLDKN